MHELSFEEALDLVRAKDVRYAREAYLFIREALDHTQKTLARTSRGGVRHVTGQELLEGIREYGLSQFGPMTLFVLGEWGIHCCADFGEIVFNLVDIGVLAKTERDSRSDFSNGYEFEEVFRKPFVPSVRARGRQHSTAP